jgi:hypothetical protein
VLLLQQTKIATESEELIQRSNETGRRNDVMMST